MSVILYNKFSIPMHKIYYILEHQDLPNKWAHYYEYNSKEFNNPEQALGAIKELVAMAERTSEKSMFPNLWSRMKDSGNWRVKKITETKTEEIVDSI